MPVLRAAVERARAEGHLGDGHPRQRLLDFDIEVTRGRGLVRGGRGDRPAGLACRACAAPSRRGRRSRPSAAGTASRPSSTTSRRSATSPSSRATAPRPTRALSPGATPGTKLVCLNERFERARRSTRSASARRCARSATDLGGGMRDGHEIKAMQIGGPLGGILPGVEARHPLRLRRAGGRGLHGRPRQHPGLRRAHRHARAGPSPARVRRPRELRQVLPLPHRAAARASRWSSATGRSTATALEALLETLELGSLCAHGGGMPAPIRSLIAHFPEELGRHGAPTGERRGEFAGDPYMRRPAEPDEDGRPGATGEGHDRRTRARGRARHHDPRGGRGRRAATCPTLCFDERMDPVRRLPRLHGRRGGRARAARRVHDALPRRHGGGHRGRDLAAHRRCHRRARDVRAAGRPRASTPSWPQVAACSASGAALARREQRTAHARPAPPLPRPPARALHLLRALRARLRRGPGRLRAHRHRARLRLGHHRRARLGLHRIDLRVLRGLRRHLPHRRDHRASLLELAAPYTGNEEGGLT